MEEGEINVENSFEFNVARDKTHIKCTATSMYVCESNLVMKCQVSGLFMLSEQSWESITKEDELVVPSFFLQHMANIVVGISRGIIFVKTEGLNVQSLPLPLIDLVSVIKEDLIIKISE
ncbi:MAG: hypothetical protein IKP37_08880 [Paludibacteraceae bacterium]|nr:hypothetical protein [Paludibacteraceae bacterium]